jgi:hypothetical protein
MIEDNKTSAQSRETRKRRRDENKETCMKLRNMIVALEVKLVLHDTLQGLESQPMAVDDHLDLATLVERLQSSVARIVKI